MKVRKNTIEKPKFIVTYLNCFFLLLVIFTIIGLIPYVGSYVSYGHDAQEFKSYMNADSIIVDYAYENNIEKERLSGEDISRIKNTLITNYLSYGQRYRIHINDGSVIDTSRTAVVSYCVLSDDQSKIIRDNTLRLADNKYLKYFDTPEVNAYKTAAREDDVMDYFERTDDDLSYIRFKCREFYADFDKGVFIPVEAEICTYTDGQGDITLSGVIVRCEPDNTEGFTLIKTQDGVSSCIGIIAGYTGTDNDSDYTEFGSSVDALISKREWTPLVQIPFTKKYSKGIMMGIAVIIVAAVAFAFIPATIRYNTKKRRYEVYEYRSRMVDAMAHDLKTPMAAVSAYAENLSNHIGTDKQEYYAGKVEEKVAQMNKMVNDILEFSKSEKEPSKITKETVNISEVIGKIISDNEVTIAERSLKISYDKKTVTVKTDENLFRQAVSNLINNAVLYSKEGTEINIFCDEKNLTITNTPEEEIGNVNDLRNPFVKGSKSRGNKGTGLGLAIANNNLAMLGYKLDIKIEEGKFVAAVNL
ncbi:MAG: HAMP domain-containing histidine kinase [Ruminococcaceae bacterium]|nr:HAMP domain-containing histidine kinase [Oscillospiraceae bacterium]